MKFSIYIAVLTGLVALTAAMYDGEDKWLCVEEALNKCEETAREETAGFQIPERTTDWECKKTCRGSSSMAELKKKEKLLVCQVICMQQFKYDEKWIEKYSSCKRAINECF